MVLKSSVFLMGDTQVACSKKLQRFQSLTKLPISSLNISSYLTTNKVRLIKFNMDFCPLFAFFAFFCMHFEMEHAKKAHGV